MINPDRFADWMAKREQRHHSQSPVPMATVGRREHHGSARHNGSRMLTAADYQTYESIVDLALHHAGLPYGFDADEERGGGLV